MRVQRSAAVPLQPRDRGAAAPWWAAAARWLLCALFLTTALGKLLDNRGFAQALGDYRLFPALLLLPLGLAISSAELAVAVGLAHPASVRPADWGRWPSAWGSRSCFP